MTTQDECIQWGFNDGRKMTVMEASELSHQIAQLSETETDRAHNIATVIKDYSPASDWHNKDGTGWDTELLTELADDEYVVILMRSDWDQIDEWRKEGKLEFPIEDYPKEECFTGPWSQGWEVDAGIDEYPEIQRDGWDRRFFAWDDGGELHNALTYAIEDGYLDETTKARVQTALRQIENGVWRQAHNGREATGEEKEAVYIELRLDDWDVIDEVTPEGEPSDYLRGYEYAEDAVEEIL